MASASEGAVDKKLADGLKRAKERPSDRPYFFALVVKGVADGVLLVGKRKITDREVADAKKETGGATVVKGVCFGEGDILVFETAKPPAPAWAALTKKAAKEDAGLGIKPEFRHGRDVEKLPDEFPAPGDGAADAVAPDAAKRFAALTGAVKSALAAKGPNAARVQVLGTAVAGLLKAGDHVQASKVLDELEPLLKATPTAPAAADPAAVWKAKLAEYTPAIKAALAAKGPNAAEVTRLFAQANALSKPGGDLAQALAKLRECYDVARAPGGTHAAAPAAPAAAPKPVAAPTAAPTAAGLAAWKAAREQVVKQVRAVANKVADTGEPGADGCIIELLSIIKNLTPNPATAQQVAELERYLTTDDVIDAAEAIPPDFGPVVVRAPLLAALAGLKS